MQRPINLFYQPPAPTTGGRQSLRPEYGGTAGIARTNKIVRLNEAREEMEALFLGQAERALRAENQRNNRISKRFKK